MNTHKTVYSKLFKQELSAEKVELALDSQLKDIEQKAQKLFNDGRSSARQKMSDAAGELDSIKNKLKALSSDIDSAYSKGKKTADELGVDLDSTSVGKSFKQATKDVQDYIMRASEVSSKISSFKI